MKNATYTKHPTSLDIEYKIELVKGVFDFRALVPASLFWATSGLKLDESWANMDSCWLHFRATQYSQTLLLLADHSTSLWS